MFFKDLKATQQKKKVGIKYMFIQIVKIAHFIKLSAAMDHKKILYPNFSLSNLISMNLSNGALSQLVALCSNVPSGIEPFGIPLTLGPFKWATSSSNTISVTRPVKRYARPNNKT